MREPFYFTTRQETHPRSKELGPPVIPMAHNLPREIETLCPRTTTQNMMTHRLKNVCLRYNCLILLMPAGLSSRTPPLSPAGTRELSCRSSKGLLPSERPCLAWPSYIRPGNDNTNTKEKHGGQSVPYVKYMFYALQHSPRTNESGSKSSVPSWSCSHHSPVELAPIDINQPRTCHRPFQASNVILPSHFASPQHPNRIAKQS